MKAAQVLDKWPAHPMEQRAERIYPRNPRLQQEWLRAVAVVRATTTGWVLDRPIAKSTGA